MKNGDYILVLAPKDYPGKKYRNRYVYEHRLVWWLKTQEIIDNNDLIHHINGNKRDNRFENLEKLNVAKHNFKHYYKNSIKTVCFKCKTIFEVRPNKYKERTQKNKNNRIFCSRSCAVSIQQKERYNT